ncbi:MAG: ankyrin repeat domain-containing protein [Parachlamydia sp.]|nr:ankyrin repeat domain-containing protein [Parachlamydia sp.]
MQDGADLHYPIKDGQTVLHAACRRDDVKLVRELWAQGADVNQVDQNGDSVLHYAARGGNRPIIDLLFYDAKCDVNQTNKEGCTPLHVATEMGHTVAIQSLLWMGAAVNLANKDGWTPLHTAAYADHEAAIALIGTADINKADRDGNTPLHIAAKSGAISTMKCLSSYGADIALTNKSGETAWQLAFRGADVPTMKKLLRSGIFSSLYVKGDDAAGIKAFLQATGDINSTDLMGSTPLHMAARRGNLDAIRILIEAGADVHKPNQYGQTALFYAGESQTSEVLIQNGSDVNTVDRDNGTPLHIAARRGYYDAFDALVTHGADINQVDNDGKTPFDIAFSNRDFYKCIAVYTRLGKIRDLLQYAIQHPVPAWRNLLEHSGIMDNDPLFQEILPLVNYEALPPLLEVGSVDALGFLEKICVAKMSNNWLSEDLSSTFPNEPFHISQNIDNPSKFTVYTPARLVSLDKSRFFQIWIQARGDPEHIKEAVLADIPPISQPTRVPEAGEYEMKLVRSELQTHPDRILETLAGEFQQAIYSKLNIHFVGEEGVDHGGLGRQFVGLLFAEIGRKMNFRKSENELFRPRLAENSAGEFQPLSENDKSIYRNLGQLMMFCLNATIPYPIGMLFDQAVFTAIAKMDPQYLEKEFDEIDFKDPQTFNKMLDLYKGINRYIEEDMDMLKRLERYLEPQKDSDLKEAYSLVQDEPSVKQLNIGNDVKKMQQHQTDIKAAVRQYVIDNNLRPLFAPIHAMARGMKEAPFNSKLNFQDVQRMSPVELSRSIQGTVSKEDILNKLRFTLSTPEPIQNWLKKWIQEADDKTIQHFLFAVSGSGALGSDAKIQIFNGDSIFFHTCYNQLDLDFANIKTEQDLVEKLNVALVAVLANAGFDAA